MTERILIVDDDEDMRLLVRLWLSRRSSAQVIGEGADGNEGLHLWRTLRPDVTVLDEAMPGLSGQEVARRIVDADPDASVVIFTGSHLDRFRQLVDDCANVEVARKPDLGGAGRARAGLLGR